jgi:hypothetical protein
MELKQLISSFTYRIQAKPEGGFIAQASDPSLPTLEAPTRFELEDKIQANISNALSTAFPGLNLPLGTKEFKFAFHIEPKPGGGFVAQSIGPDSKPIEGATHEEVHNRFVEKLADYLLPTLSNAIGRQLNSGDIRIFVNPKVNVSAKTVTHKWTFGNGNTLLPVAGQPGATLTQQIGSLRDPSDNSPIKPETNRSGTIFRLLMILLGLGALLYFFLRYR